MEERYMDAEKIRDLVKQMTLEEKAGMCSGADFWHTKSVERLEIPSVMLSDGPHGLRKQEEKGDHLGMGDSIEAVCFPAGCLSASSFDREMLRKLGETLGNECQAENVSVILGPAMNIKRSPLCGRNFEYYSEDPLVSTELATAYIEGVQSKHVGTSPKHFLANNQEHYRLTGSSEVDERTLREIYLASFEGAVKNAKPWTVMGSYNRVNGVFATENKKYLTDVLRDEWGFDGYVVSDWGAVNERVPGLKAGLDLEMPSSNGVNDRKIVEAVQNGELDEEILDRTCERILDVVYRYLENRDENAVFDREKDHDTAEKIAEESMVLLKNDGGLLPFDKNQKIAFIGHYAKEPRYQGGGSSHIHSSRVVSALEAAKENDNILFAQGFTDDAEENDPALVEEAVKAAQQADAAVLFLGLPERYESEGFDRKHMKLPKCQNRLVEEILKVQKNVAVVLHNGSPVEMPWADQIPAILESYLAGEAVGDAQYRILFGDVNPSGKLAETFPLRLEDNPTYPYYGREGEDAVYREGVLVGYRYYDTKHMKVLFPFGHGLSYTEFEYSDLELSAEKMKDTDTLQVSVIVKNTGNRAGKEVVQLYVAPKDPEFVRPEKELRAFEKISLEPGESRKVTFTLGKRAFAYWNVTLHDWHVVSGEYEILIGKSSRDIVQQKAVQVESTVTVPYTFTKNSTFGEIFKRPEKMQAVMELFGAMGGVPMDPDAMQEQAGEGENIEMMKAMLMYSPIRSMVGFMGLEDEKVEAVLAKLNE